MKTKFKLAFASILFAGIVGGSAQNNASTTTLTSGGNTAGTTGSGAYYGYQAGKVSTGAANTFIGNSAGTVNSTGQLNAFLGQSAGANNTTGSRNSFIGRGAGSYNSTGSDNTFTGYNSGSNAGCASAPSACLTAGNYNAFYGGSSGLANYGNQNSFFGTSCGSNNSTGGNNTFLGYNAGFKDGTGSGNVCIGSNSGYRPGGVQSIVENQLFVDNSSTATPLIWGDFANDQLKLNGKVGVGAVTAFPLSVGGVSVANYRLFVTGGILAEEVRVALNSPWADYVFAENYKLKPLSEVESFIKDNGHLPNVPSAKQVKEEGIELANMSKIQQEKIEELTLYLIQQNKEIETLKAQVNALLNKK